MRILLTCAIVLCATVAFAAEPFASISFDDACKKAKAENKVVAIDFYTTWCGPCKMLESTTWKDGDVCAWLSRNTVAIKIDGDRNTQLCRQYKIRAYPTILFLRADGGELDRLVGYCGPEGFLEDAKAAVRNKGSVAPAAAPRADAPRAEAPRAEAPSAAAPRAEAPMITRVTNDPVKRMQHGVRLVQEGKKKEAIVEYLWCFDHGLEASTAFSSVRLSYLVSYIHHLGTSYKPAMEALCDRRDRAEKALLDGASDKKAKDSSDSSGYPRSRFEAASEVSAINQELNEQGRTADVYKKLMTKGEKDRRILSVFIDEVLDPLIASSEYSSIVAGLPNPLATVEQKIESYRSIQEYERSKPQEADRSSSEHFKRRALDQGSKIYEALVGVKDLTNAHRIAQRILRFDGSGGIYKLLMERALRAEGSEEVVWLLQLAREKLETEEFSKLERLATKPQVINRDANHTAESDS
jgi:thiol-disulfide isomerase/thioredoxin